MTPFPTKFATALRAFFAQHLPLTRGLSPRTVLSYRDTFVLLLRFLAARHGCGVVDLELQHLRVGDDPVDINRPAFPVENNDNIMRILKQITIFFIIYEG